MVSIFVPLHTLNNQPPKVAMKPPMRSAANSEAVSDPHNTATAAALRRNYDNKPPFL